MKVLNPIFLAFLIEQGAIRFCSGEHLKSQDFALTVFGELQHDLNKNRKNQIKKSMRLSRANGRVRRPGRTPGESIVADLLEVSKDLAVELRTQIMEAMSVVAM